MIGASGRTGPLEYDKVFDEGKRAGIKEVVEWIEGYFYAAQLGHDMYLIGEIRQRDWQAQKKEWEL